MSTQRAQSEITSSEFMDWIAFLDEDINTVKVEHHYLAQIAAEIRVCQQFFVKHPIKVKLESFFFKFIPKKKKKKLTVEEKTKRDKKVLGSLFGFYDEMK